MKLENEFPELEVLLKRMKAKRSEWRPGVSTLSPLEELRLELEDGKEIPLSKVETSHGRILAYQGEQVVLYIRDTRLSRHILENEPENSRRFHVADCRVLENMRHQGRFERYVVTNRKTGVFSVISTDPDTKAVDELEAPLMACKTCLKTINWKGYEQAHRAQKDEIWRNFDMEDFFAEYATFFRQKPKHSDKTAPKGGYAKNWSQRSTQFREQRNWTCEKCRVELSDHKRLLHCHHKNGDITNNSDSNIEVLCVLCHAEQPLHGHMKVKPKDRLTIERKRRE